MQTYLKTFLGALLLITALTGCNNTIKGVGEDMQATGKAIQKSAEDK